MTTQQLYAYARRAIDDFSMIETNDKIAIGVSGGKDSLALVKALTGLKRFYSTPFELCAILVSLGFEHEDVSELDDFCKENNIEFHVVKTDIGEVVFNYRKEKNPCALCSKMRKGALNEKAKSLGCNKIALGHHKDDVIETFFMSLFLEGRIHTFAPKIYWDRMDLYAIRPLVYCEEKDIISFIENENIAVMKNPCVVDGHTKREEFKEFVKEESIKYPLFREKVFGAITRSTISGWQKTKVGGRKRRKSESKM